MTRPTAAPTPSTWKYVPETSSPGTRSVCPFTPTFIATGRRANSPEKIGAVVLTSATLSIGGSHGFDFFKERYGFPAGDAALQLGSPFDYRPLRRKLRNGVPRGQRSTELFFLYPRLFGMGERRVFDQQHQGAPEHGDGRGLQMQLIFESECGDRDTDDCDRPVQQTAIFDGDLGDDVVARHADCTPDVAVLTDDIGHERNAKLGDQRLASLGL